MTVLFYAKIQQDRRKTDVENGNCCSCVAFTGNFSSCNLFQRKIEGGILV